ncbi:hypothetical protein [Sphingopyxis sp. KK2]|uniref:hypothetical protein n=1 Tax=Sphingopyxis sp. KK2 TaxID=1855727 RepID=UPI001181B92B|nr:hypothetical protein [Sphingopyxis sp. KK2]
MLGGRAVAQDVPAAGPAGSTPAVEALPAATAPLPVAAGAARGPSLSAGTPVIVMLNDEISTMSSHVGDRFGVTVLYDVVDYDHVVIPAGTTGYGEVTFSTNKGGFGKPGIVGISLRQLDLGGRPVALDGRYREEGQSKNGATVATWFAVGVFSGFIKGKPGVIPKGRELKARTGEAIAYTIAPLPVAALDASALAAITGDIALPAPTQSAPNPF